MHLLSSRNSLEKTPFDENANASLWIDKFIKGQNYGETKKDEEVFKQTLIDEATKILLPKIYQDVFFACWKESLKAISAKFKTLELDGRMIIGLGGESVLETSITLHRIYGVPFIPGSALKGLAANYAHKHLGTEWKKDGKFHRLVFGSQDFAGVVVFHDALLIPESDKLPLHNEVMTVHHSDYYNEKKDEKGDIAPPADWDSPTPISFLSASGKYLLALSTESSFENVIDKTFEILKLALKEEGIGAKTSSGYGRGHFEKGEEEIAADRESADVERFIVRVKAIRNSDVASQINNYFQEWKNSTLSDASKKRMAQAIIEKVREAGREKASKDKGWYQDLLKFVA